jgi:hypothetical protein
MHNEELHNWYSTQKIFRVNKSRRMRWVGHMAHTGEMRNAHKILTIKPYKKDYLDDQTNEQILGKIWWKCADWIHVPQDRVQWQALVNTVMYLQVP